MTQEKIKWSLLFLLDISLFLLALVSGILVLNLVVICLSIVIYKYGNPILFEVINSRRKQQLEDSKIVREAVHQVIQSKAIVSKQKHKK